MHNPIEEKIQENQLRWFSHEQCRPIDRAKLINVG